MKLLRFLPIVLAALTLTSSNARAQFCTDWECDNQPPEWQPPASPAPVLTIVHHPDYVNSVQGSATAMYGTPAYTSLDQPRGVSLLYSSGLAAPRTLVRVNAWMAEAPARLSIRVRNSATGAWQTFPNGSQELFYTGAAGTSHLAAQFDVGGLASGAYPFDVVVRAHWSDGTTTETVQPVRVLVVNESASPYGAGWIIAGLQRVIPGAGGVMVLNGDGSAQWFAYPGSCEPGMLSYYCNYTPPEGEFGRLATTPSGGWVRYSETTFTKTEFGPDGRMTLLSEGGGLVTTFGYDAAGRLSTITDPAGKVLHLGYDGAGKLAWIDDPGGRRVTFRVTASGVLDQICDPEGCPFGGWYDAQRRLAWSTDRAGTRWDYAYDAFGQLQRTTEPAIIVDGGAVVRPSSTVGSLAAAVLPSAGTGTMSSPAPWLDPEAVRVTATDPALNETRFQLDRYGSPTRIESPGRVTTIERDPSGRPLRTVAFNGDVTEYTYVGARPATVQDVTNGRTTTFTWTAYNTCCIETGNWIYPAGTYYDYPVLITTPGEPDAEYMRLLSQPVPLRLGSSRYVYEEVDAYGRPGVVYGPGGHTRSYFAATGAMNLDSVSTSSGNEELVTRFSYDSFGRVVKTKDHRGTEITTNYDALNRPTTSGGPAGSTIYTYSSAGWLHTVTDPLNQVYTYTRNALGWLETEQDPRGGLLRMTYDVLGQAASATNRRGQTVRYEYDGFGQMIRRTSHEGAVTTYGYDPAGLWISAENAESADTLRNFRGSTPSVDQISARAGVRYVLNTRRDHQSNSSVVTSNWGYGLTHVYLNDQSGRVRQIHDHATGLYTSIVRDEALNRTIRLLPSGDSIIQGVTETRYTDPSAASTLGRSYVYDAMGWVSQRSRPGAYNDVFLHDVRGQLSSEVRYDAAWYPLTGRSYAYDAAANPADAGTVVTAGNRLEWYNGYALTYDADGNLIRKYKPEAGIDWFFTWNSLGQLVQASGTSNAGASWHVVTYGYDGWGRRVRQTANGVTTRFLYDGQHVVSETDGAGAVVRSFTYYEGVDRPHSMRVGGQTYYYITDHQGSVTGLVNSSGTLVNHYEYSPFGTAVVASEAVANPLRYAGGRVDLETGLSFNRVRYYDPALQRFISEDPLGLAAGANVYSYAGNNPLNLRDPSGMNPCPGGKQLINGTCGVYLMPTIRLRLYVRPPGGSAVHAPWFRPMYGDREYIIGVATEYEYLQDLSQQYQDQLQRERVLAAVQSTRGAADLGVGFVPGVSTIHDVSVLLSGFNVITGERVGLGGRGIALIGAVTPVSGGQIRAGGAAIGKLLNGLSEGALKYPGKVGRWEWHHVEPKYLGGAANGDRRFLPAEYHQLITNAFRELAAYGNGAVSAARQSQIMRDVYARFPIDLFPRW